MMTKNDIWVLYSTFATREEALFVARSLVERKLIACANIHDNAVSVYRWQGAVTEEPEAIMVAKTSKQRLDEAMAAIKQLHPYQLPCIVAYPVQEGLPEYLQWVADEII